MTANTIAPSTTGSDVQMVGAPPSLDDSRQRLQKLLLSGDVKNGRRTRSDAERILPAIREQAGLQGRTSPALDDQLTTFVVEAVLGAAWYTRAAAKATRQIWFYIGLNSALVMLLPIALWALGTLSSYSPIIPQLSGVLTGIFALQKTLSAWFAQQQRYAAWYKAGSDLKSVYYGFIDACQASPNADDASIIALLRDRTARSREIIQAEKTDFYQRLALPSFDVLDMLTANRSAVSAYVGSFNAASPAQKLTALGTKSFVTPSPDPDASPDQVGLDNGAEVEMLAGDPDDTPSTLDVMDGEGYDDRLASLQLVSERVVDPKALFLEALKVAGEEADDGVSRASNRPRVTEYLALLNYPFAGKDGVPTRYCAAGVTWAAAKAYCDVAALSYDPASELDVFKRNLSNLRPFFRPSAGCQVIQDAAKAAGNWVSRLETPQPGWLVLYHWKIPTGADVAQLVPDHIGYVVRRVGDTLHTIEFNTTNKKAGGSQSDGGAVARRDDRSIANVVGYVATYPTPALEIA